MRAYLLACVRARGQAVCTISGKLYTDKVSLAGLGPVDVTLGSIESQTTNFDQFKEIDGVMGFTQVRKGVTRM